MVRKLIIQRYCSMRTRTATIYFQFIQRSLFRFSDYLKVVLSILTASAVWFGVAHSATLNIEPLSVANLTKRSDVIALGPVTSVLSEWNSQKTTIYTRIGLSVEESFKGTASGEKLSFYQLGGEVGDTASSVGEAAAFNRAERVIVFLYRNKEQKLELVASFQGKFSIEERGQAGGLMAIRRVPGTLRPLDEMPLERIKNEIQTALAK
jgi:hypothetical protein